jgi:hypothetical protein
VVVGGRGATFFLPFFTPLATNRAFRWAASYRRLGRRAKAANRNAGGKRCAAPREKRISYHGRKETT